MTERNLEAVEKYDRELEQEWPLTSEVDELWSKVKALLSAFESLEQGGEPKMAAAVLGKAHDAAKEWSRVAQPSQPQKASTTTTTTETTSEKTAQAEEGA